MLATTKGRLGLIVIGERGAWAETKEKRSERNDGEKQEVTAHLGLIYMILLFVRKYMDCFCLVGLE